MLKDVEVQEKLVKQMKNSTYKFAVLSFFLWMLVIVVAVGDIYTRGASVFVERSIEILAPTIPPEKVLQLRAEYRSVDSAQKFYDLHDELQTIAKEKNVQLPKFIVIKR